MVAASMGVNAAEPDGPLDLITNPYAGYGSPVAGPEFVGRTTAISSIRNRTFTSLETASVSIVGPPRVGKSSLARHVHDQLATGRSVRGLTFVPVWITVSGCDSEQSLFRELAYAVQTWMSDRDLHADRLEPLYESLSAVVSWDDMRMRLRTYMRRLRRLQYQVVAVLDEFDAARNVFRRPEPYEFLRALAYEPDVRVALITTSRRGLAEIVVRSTPELSTFPQIFGLPVTLGCFDTRELTALIARSPHIGPDLRQPLLTWLGREAGGQPFLASALLSVLHDRWAIHGVPPPAELPHHLGEAVATCSDLTVRHHEHMLELLRDEDRLKTLLEVLFGPQVNAQPQDAERLAREGIIRPTADGWEGFSENFQEYLGLLERRSDDWSLWQLTETRLRAGLTTALRAAYGDLWLVKLRECQKRLIEKCESRQERVQRGFRELAPDESPLDYAYPQDLLAIIMMHWEQLRPALGHSKDGWQERLELIARVRTPMAHNRRSGTSPLLMERFREYCQDVLRWLPQPTDREPSSASSGLRRAPVGDVDAGPVDQSAVDAGIQP
ncbi:AAA family ATPase [Streptomyces marianii]|uniref:ATP-binding protein n=1 Tax=Streptomyces marianii TaxID=1817406 RepID=A0A5R9DYP3_9ACTN|nr:ATP-binding protein [Streptomyces marianii]TLQ42506.1 ATP-binding protein [Streptomyces marianii]